MGAGQVAAAILQLLPDILPLEAWRWARGWSRPQALAAFLALYEAEGRPTPPVTTAMLCRWEHGTVAMSRDYEHMLCRLYGMSPNQLRPGAATASAPAETPRHPRSVTRRDGAVTVNGGSYDGEGINSMRRRTVLAAGLSIPLAALQRVDDALAVPPRSDSAELAQAAARLRAARRQFDRSELADLVAALPGLLASATAAAEQADTPAGWALVSATYRLATDTLSKVGSKPSARITADRAVLYAARSGDPVAAAASDRTLGMMLRSEGRPATAAAVMSRGIDNLEATGLSTTAQAALYLRLLSARAYTYAWAGDRARALEGIGEAERAAARIPAMQPTAAPFARLYRVDIHYALGDAGTALYAARGLRDDMYRTPERRGRLHTDLARAWWQWGKPEETAAELLAAYGHAPAEVTDRPSIRTIAAELVKQHPRVAGVRQLSKAISPRTAVTV